jgi:hypothetical protein
MLKRLSSLILALMVGGSVLAGTARLHDEHVCKMAGVEMMPVVMEMMPRMATMPGMEMTPGMETMSDMETMPGMEMTPGMETMPCCKKHGTQAVVSESGSPGECCIMIPQEPGSSGTTFSLRSPSFSIAVIHPALVQSPLTLPKPYERPYSTQIFLPNLQATYIRNLSFLI